MKLVNWAHDHPLTFFGVCFLAVLTLTICGM